MQEVTVSGGFVGRACARTATGIGALMVTVMIDATIDAMI
jgi:hypothetical protein